MERTPEELWLSCTKLALAIARRHSRWAPWGTRDDLEQAAHLGLWKAAVSWREGRAPWTAYARFCINNTVVEEVWRLGFWGLNAGRASHDGTWQEPRRHGWNSTDKGGVFSDLIPKVSPDFSLDDHDLAKFMIQQLKPYRVQEVSRRYWVMGQSSLDIAQDMHMPLSTVQASFREGRKKMAEVAKTLQRIWER